MNIDFQTKNCELVPEFREYIARKLSGLTKFYHQDTTRIFVDIEQNPAVQSGPELFRVGIKIDSPEGSIFTEEKESDMRRAFDKAHKEIVRMVKTERGKSQNLARRAGAKIKSLFKRLR